MEMLISPGAVQGILPSVINAASVFLATNFVSVCSMVHPGGDSRQEAGGGQGVLGKAGLGPAAPPGEPPQDWGPHCPKACGSKVLPSLSNAISKLPSGSMRVWDYDVPEVLVDGEVEATGSISDFHELRSECPSICSVWGQSGISVSGKGEAISQLTLAGNNCFESRGLISGFHTEVSLKQLFQ